MNSLTSKFRSSPSLFYAMSIAATWANAGSLLNGIITAQNQGILPYLLWALGNTLACIIFGIFAPIIPRLRDVFHSKPMQMIMGIMCPFQCWISMNGIQTVFASTPAGERGGILIALAFAVFFIILLYRYGMIRNVLTDNLSWAIVYSLIFILTIIVLLTGDHMLLETGAQNIGQGLKNCILLIPGAFLYPYYYKILDYNEENEDGTKKVNIRKAFIGGGLAFGIYLIFIFLMAFAVFSPFANIIKAILVTLIAISSLSSFQYSIYLIFGRRIGIILNILTVLLWQFLIPLGVMGAWTLMAGIRIHIVIFAIIFAYIWDYLDHRKSGQTTG